ncbi:unnamed protein product [Chrysoparadoxa australica]
MDVLFDRMEMLDVALNHLKRLQEGESVSAAFKEKAAEVLHFLFHKDETLLNGSIDVLDTSKIVKCVGSVSGRTLHLVQSCSKGGQHYLCLEHYCSCPAYQHAASKTTEPVLCKHLLAVRMAPVLGKITESVVPDKVILDQKCGAMHSSLGVDTQRRAYLCSHYLRISTLILSLK